MAADWPAAIAGGVGTGLEAAAGAAAAGVAAVWPVVGCAAADVGGSAGAVVGCGAKGGLHAATATINNTSNPSRIDRKSTF